MKNLKTIVALLVLTVLTFSCQTNDELLEVEELNSYRPSNLSTSRSNTLSTSILIEYKSWVSASRRQEIRDEFEQEGIVFIDVVVCTRNSETWKVEEINFPDFYNIVVLLADGIVYHPTGLNGSTDEGFPIDSYEYKIIYNSNCFGPINVKPSAN